MLGFLHQINTIPIKIQIKHAGKYKIKYIVTCLKHFAGFFFSIENFKVKINSGWKENNKSLEENDLRIYTAGTLFVPKFVYGLFN